MLAGPQATTLLDVTVQGDVDLTGLERVGRPLRCQNCRFTGAFRGTDLILERIVDFSGTTFEGPVDLSAALFQDRAGFENVVFAGPATFGSTRFTADASFADTEFHAPALFDRAQFGAAAALADTTFGADASFQAAQFTGGADFAGADFGGPSNFAAAGFGQRSSFARATFSKLAEFRGAAFPAGANLGVEKFNQGFNLESVTAGGSIEFLGAALEGEGVLANLSSTGTVALDGIRVLEGNSQLFLDQISVARLTMDVEEIAAVRGRNVQKSVLKLVEKSGRESGDLALANRARFQLLDLEGDEKRGFSRLVDRLLLRDVGGYLVRPSHPLVTLLLAILMAGLMRSARPLEVVASVWRAERDSATGFKRRAHLVLLQAGKATEKLLDGISSTVQVAISRKADHIKREDSERILDHVRVWVLWGEFLAYKTLLAAFLLALGNSNSTVRQLLEAVTG
jgi:hypothetical protein